MAPNNISDEGNSLVVHQWLGLHAFTAKGVGSIPGWETVNLQAAQHGGGGGGQNQQMNSSYLASCL